MSCAFSQNTIKVPEGNSWQMLLPLKTAKWRGDRLVTETIDYRALENIAIFIDGVEYNDWQKTEDGPLVNMPAGQFENGPHNTVLTALYFGVEVKASYFENFTIVAWSFESNVGEHLQDSPLISEPAYIYVGITDDAELEALKQQYRNAIAETETARLAYEASKEAYDEKAESLNNVAQETTSQSILTAVGNIHIDTDDLAKEQTLTQGVADIRNDISHIDIDTSTLAKQGTNANATNTAILAAVGDLQSILNDVNNEIAEI